MLKIEYMSDSRGYFDYAATAPTMEVSIKAFLEGCSSRFGNPSSRHHLGLEAKKAMDAARRRMLSLLGASGGASMILTSGGSESNNLVLGSMKAGDSRPGGALLGIAVDSHPSGWYPRELCRERVRPIETDRKGRLVLESIVKAIEEGCGLISISHVNSETGVIQDLEAIRDLCSARGVALHVDGVQALGHIRVNLGDAKGLFYTFSSHKFGAPRGTGGIVTGSPEDLEPQIFGGPQENGKRAGTENVAGLMAAVAALEHGLGILPDLEPRLRAMGSMAASRLMEEFPEGILNSSVSGVPGLVSFSLKGLNPAIVLTTMALSGFCLSSGSACHEGAAEPSRTIRAMGRDRATALGTLRISMGYATTAEDAQNMIDTLVGAIRQCMENR